MSKRTWWVEDSKQENAHLVWTQLKIYEVYKNQRCEKQQPKAKPLSSLSLTSIEDESPLSGFLTTS